LQGISFVSFNVVMRGAMLMRSARPTFAALSRELL